MFVALVIVIVLLGATAILLTIEGAVSGRNLTLGLLLAGMMLGVQGAALAYSAMNPPVAVVAEQPPAAPGAP